MPDDGGDVLRDQVGRVGIGPVENELHGRILLPFDVFREVPVDPQHPLNGPPVEEIPDSLFMLDDSDNPEIPGGRKRCDQFPALLTAAQVHDAQPDVPDIHVHGVAEDDQLDEGGKKEDDPRPLVSKDLNEFLPDDVLDSHR